MLLAMALTLRGKFVVPAGERPAGDGTIPYESNASGTCHSQRRSSTWRRGSRTTRRLAPTSSSAPGPQCRHVPLHAYPIADLNPTCMLTVQREGAMASMVSEIQAARHSVSVTSLRTADSGQEDHQPGNTPRHRHPCGRGGAGADAAVPGRARLLQDC